MDRTVKAFFVFVAVALVALLLGYFLLNSALRSATRRRQESKVSQKSIPGSLLSSPRAYFWP